ncbi:MAG: PRC-barrel domain-containing protein [Paralcaligenes sp.]
MKKILASTILSLPLLIAQNVLAQTSAPTDQSVKSSTPEINANPGVAPSATAKMNSTVAGTTNTRVDGIVTGWSVKDKVMGKTMYNENKEKVGEINDIIIAPDGKSTFFIVSVGGFLGMGDHAVAIPFSAVTSAGDKLVLQGYTKSQLKSMPEFKYIR